MAKPKPTGTAASAVFLTLLVMLCGRANAQIVAFGASNISGWNVAASEAIPAQLQTMLRAKGYNVRVMNAGIFGNTTADMRNRMDSDIPEGTTIVILDTSGGLHNDAQKGISRAQGDANLRGDPHSPDDPSHQGECVQCGRHSGAIPSGGRCAPDAGGASNGRCQSNVGNDRGSGAAAGRSVSSGCLRGRCARPARRNLGTTRNVIFACRSIVPSSPRIACTRSPRAGSGMTIERNDWLLERFRPGSVSRLPGHYLGIENV